MIKKITREDKGRLFIEIPKKYILKKQINKETYMYIRKATKKEIEKTKGLNTSYIIGE